MVTAERGKPVIIVYPGRWQVAPKLRDAAIGTRVFQLHRLLVHADHRTLRVVRFHIDFKNLPPANSASLSGGIIQYRTFLLQEKPFF